MEVGEGGDVDVSSSCWGLGKGHDTIYGAVMMVVVVVVNLCRKNSSKHKKKKESTQRL
jgi:hypothetical protein